MEGALKELTALRAQLHKTELDQTRDITEVRTVLEAVVKDLAGLRKLLQGNGLAVARLIDRVERLETEKGEPGAVAAAKVTAKGSVNVQLIATIGAVISGLAGLVIALLNS